jgi:hypothetical protein
VSETPKVPKTTVKTVDFEVLFFDIFLFILFFDYTEYNDITNSYKNN